MTQKTFLSTLIILFLFPGCSLIHKVFRKQEAPAPQRQVVRMPIPGVQLNTGGPPSKIVKRHHTYVYETVRSAGRQQFVITDMPILVKPPERAVNVKLRINLPASPTTTRKPMPMHKPVPVANGKEGDSFASTGKKEKPTTQSIKAIKTVRVQFGLNSYAISQAASRKLRDFIKYYVRLLKDTEIPSVGVTGYTCWLGTKEYNQSLALKRARAVALRLKKAGVAIRSVSGKGKCCYIDRKNPAPNRRAEVTVFPSGAKEDSSRKGGGAQHNI